jgi:protein-disulfide isomerase
LLLVALASNPSPWRARLLKIILWIVVAAVSFSAALMYVQFAVLHAFCVLCTASAAVLLALVFSVAKSSRHSANQFPGSSSAAAALASFATLGFAALFPWNHVLENGITGARLKFGAAQAVSIDLAYAEFLGAKDAKVEMIVFSDFTCKFCIEFAEVLKKVRAEFPNEVRIAYLSFPLTDKGPALSAAVAAKCAAEQSAYWPYHDRLFAERSELTDARLLSIAAEAGLDQGRFGECFRSDRARKKVEAGLQDALRSGIKGVPTIFRNGARISSLVDYPTLERQIKMALQKDAAARGEHPPSPAN